jgi:predicted RNA-binding Zn-ribbon protein involved in translation (DUF1610 family)
MARSAVGVVEDIGVVEEPAAAVKPRAAGSQVVCPRCEAVLATRVDLRRVRHVLLRCSCGGFQRVALADVA